MDRNIRWLSFGAVIRASGLSLILPYVALYLRNVLGLGYAEIGVLGAILGVAPLLLYPFGGAIADRLGRRKLLLAALLHSAGLGAAYSNLPHQDAAWWRAYRDRVEAAAREAARLGGADPAG